ncbi:MAG: DUF3164 family protein [Hyphomonadaceae bacterium]|jgi:hypothetical protein|nr:DUF3164 family protein [Hyphomonadaceae bacterium]
MIEAETVAALKQAEPPPQSRYPAFEPRAHVVSMEGKPYWHDSRGALVPERLVSAKDQLIDEVVRKQIHFAMDLSDQVARFKTYCFAELAGLMDLLAQDYQVQVGGEKGNTTFLSYDGCQKVQVQIGERMEFGPEIKVAKAIIDECLHEWTGDSHDVIRALIERIFNVGKEGQIDRAALFQLMRMDVADERWRRGVAAIRDSIRVTGTKRYIRFYWRADTDGEWSAITIDLAAAPVGAAQHTSTGDGRS